MNSRYLMFISITMQRTRAQFTPRKNGCCFTSFAPSRDPSLFLGSLCNNRHINCFAWRLTCIGRKFFKFCCISIIMKWAINFFPAKHTDFIIEVRMFFDYTVIIIIWWTIYTRKRRIKKNNDYHFQWAYVSLTSLLAENLRSLCRTLANVFCLVFPRNGVYP